MHDILSMIGNLHDTNKEEAARQALGQAKFHFTQIKDWSGYETQLHTFLRSKNVQRFFDCEDAQVFTEKEIINRLGHVKRCDRLVVREREAWIIDFKSTKDTQGRYAEQVQEYKEIMRDIYPTRTVKGFLMYLDNFEVEEV